MAYATPWLFILMVLESFAIGFYEEILFRGVLLRPFIELFGDNQRRVIYAVFVSSLIFGLTHVINFRAGASAVAVLTQVGYSFAVICNFPVEKRNREIKVLQLLL